MTIERHDVSYDDWREVMNSDQTYEEVARILRSGTPVVLGWTDGGGTHLDVLFAWRARQYGSLRGGLRAGTDLFVSVMRIGAFGFEAPGNGPSHVNYISSKLGSTTDALADLINGVRQRLGADHG